MKALPAFHLALSLVLGCGAEATPEPEPEPTPIKETKALSLEDIVGEYNATFVPNMDDSCAPVSLREARGVLTVEGDEWGNYWAHYGPPYAMYMDAFLDGDRLHVGGGGADILLNLSLRVVSRNRLEGIATVHFLMRCTVGYDVVAVRKRSLWPWPF